MNEDDTLFFKRAFVAATQPVTVRQDDFNIHQWRKQVNADGDLGMTDKAVASVLAEYCNGNQSVCWPTLDQIAAALGKEPKNSERFSKNTEKLARFGYLQRVKRNDSRTANWVYRLKHPWMVQVSDERIREVANTEDYWRWQESKWKNKYRWLGEKVSSNG